MGKNNAIIIIDKITKIFAIDNGNNTNAFADITHNGNNTNDITNY